MIKNNDLNGLYIFIKIYYDIFTEIQWKQLWKLTTKRLSDDCVDLKNHAAEKADYSLRYPHLHRNGQDWFYISVAF